MHRFRSPPKPAGFDQSVQAPRDAARAGAPNPDLEEGVWKGFKDKLSEAQHRKCGFCEVVATGTMA